jgi:hypothetical protein
MIPLEAVATDVVQVPPASTTEAPALTEPNKLAVSLDGRVPRYVSPELKIDGGRQPPQVPTPELTTAGSTPRKPSEVLDDLVWLIRENSTPEEAVELVDEYVRAGGSIGDLKKGLAGGSEEIQNAVKTVEARDVSKASEIVQKLDVPEDLPEIEAIERTQTGELLLKTKDKQGNPEVVTLSEYAVGVALLVADFALFRGQNTEYLIHSFAEKFMNTKISDFFGKFGIDIDLSSQNKMTEKLLSHIYPDQLTKMFRDMKVEDLRAFFLGMSKETRRELLAGKTYNPGIFSSFMGNQNLSPDQLAEVIRCINAEASPTLLGELGITDLVQPPEAKVAT